MKKKNIHPEVCVLRNIVLVPQRRSEIIKITSYSINQEDYIDYIHRMIQRTLKENPVVKKIFSKFSFIFFHALEIFKVRFPVKLPRKLSIKEKKSSVEKRCQFLIKLTKGGLEQKAFQFEYTSF